MDRERIARGVRLILEGIGEDPDRPGLRDTPSRVADLYAEVCGWTLARAHAKSGDAATISGYLGKGDSFDQAIGAFALAYADQTEREHAALVKAVRSGRLEALVEE